MLLQKEILLSSIRLHKLFTRTLFFYARPVRLAYKPYFFSQRTVFFSQNKSANSTFSHGLSAKRIGPVEGIWRNLEEFGREWTVFSAMNSECRLILRAVEGHRGFFGQGVDIIQSTLEVWTGAGKPLMHKAVVSSPVSYVHSQNKLAPAHRSTGYIIQPNWWPWIETLVFRF